jgi:hypothetical protein
MAKGYPSRSRARKAYMRGVKAAKTGRGLNPYRNERLKVLFDRGRANTPRPAGPTGPLRPSSDVGDTGRPRVGESRPRSSGSSSFGRSSGGYGRDSGNSGRRRF